MTLGKNDGGSVGDGHYCPLAELRGVERSKQLKRLLVVDG